MFKLFRVFEAATRDAWLAETLMDDAISRGALRTDPDAALLAFELRASAIGDHTGEREKRFVRRDSGVRAAQGHAPVS